MDAAALPAAHLLRHGLPRDALVILNFHRVGDELPPWHHGTSPVALERIATAFSRALRPVALADVLERGIRGRMLALTFDDGFSDSASVAAPLLERLGLPGAFFLTAASLETGQPPWPDLVYARVLALPPDQLPGLLAQLDLPPGPRSPLEDAHRIVHALKYRPPEAVAGLLASLPEPRWDAGQMLTWDAAKSLLERGFEVGAHGLTHVPLPRLDGKPLLHEVRASKRLIEDRLDTRCDLLAYPDNQADGRSAEAAAAAGFRLALTGGDRTATPLDDLMLLPRLSGEDARIGVVAARALESVNPAAAALGRLYRRSRPRSADRRLPAESGPVFWLVPALPPRSTFLARELEALEQLGVDVVPVGPEIGPESVRAFARRPLRALRLALELQLLKAPLDRERGRPGYAALFLRGLTLAARIGDSPGRVHAAFADGVGTVAYVASELTGHPYSFTAHAPYSLWQHSRLLARQAHAADVVVCASDGIEQGLRALAGEIHTRVVRVPAPRVDAARRRRLEPPHLLLCVGQLIPHKGFSSAIRGAAAALAAGADVELEVIGDGPERPELEALVRSLGVAGRIRLVGAQPNDYVLERLAEALVLLAPCEVQPDSDRDGLPASIVDAAACGVPTIATPVSSIPEIVRHEETGLLVPERDPERLGDAIHRLAGDPAFADELGAAARRVAEAEFDPIEVTRSLVSAWNEAELRRYGVSAPRRIW